MRNFLAALAAAALVACGGGDSSSPPATQPESEPNDIRAEADPVSFGWISGSTSDALDTDYFQFTVEGSAPAAVRIETLDPAGPACNGTVDTVATLYSSGGSTMEWNDDTVGGCSLVQYVVAPGTYYVEIASALDAFPYLVNLSALAMPVESEPNDDGAVATSANDFSALAADGPFSADTTVIGALTPAGDEDVYAVTNPTASSVSVTFRTYTGWTGQCDFGDTYLYVHNAAGTVLASNDDSFGLCSVLSRTLAAGETIYLRVGEFGDNGTISSYLLSIDFP